MAERVECDGICLSSADIGVPGYGIAYPHPGCPKHAPDQVCGCGQPDRCDSYTHDPVWRAEHGYASVVWLGVMSLKPDGGGESSPLWHDEGHERFALRLPPRWCVVSQWGDRSDDAPVVDLSPRTRRVLALVAWFVAVGGALALVAAIVWGQP